VLPDDDFVNLWTTHVATGAGSGPSALSGDHGLPLVHNPDTLQGLACIVSRIRNGRLDNRFKPLLLSCWLVGVPKPDGGTRPIAVSESLYKMATFHVLKSVAGVIPPVLGTSQVAILRSETAGLLLKALSEASLMFSLDLRNAFNSVDRAMMLEAPYAEIDLFRLVDFAYSAPSDLLLRDRDNLLCSVAQSRNGTRQGDPLGMLLFCLVIKAHIATALASTAVPIRALAVADDVTFVGPADIMALQWRPRLGSSGASALLAACTLRASARPSTSRRHHLTSPSWTFPVMLMLRS
jgi:hypothetical protein